MSLCKDILAELRNGKSVKAIITIFQRKGYSLGKIKAAIISAIELAYEESMNDLEERKVVGTIKEGKFVAELNAIEKKRKKMITAVAKQIAD